MSRSIKKRAIKTQKAIGVPKRKPARSRKIKVRKNDKIVKTPPMDKF